MDYDTSEDGVPYYAWWIRVPAAENTRRDTDGIPRALAPLRRHLASELPAGLEWEIAPDREQTIDHAASSDMRALYEDLIGPFERALMPLRVDGADALDPQAQVWKWEEQPLVGTFHLWLCEDRDSPPPHSWTVASVGLWTEPQLFDEEPAATIGHFGFTPHHPLLFLPRPPAPSTFTARVETGAFPMKGKFRTRGADAIGTAHQWTANDPTFLAERVARDLKILMPHLLRG
ncbi:hypothetical protein [Embleya sp. NPDC059237]|uniref:hypothetical protein n=1 Tax=Embleya sp. NPDC059237 TaxID=3346784 RepID=UPI0036AAD411